MKTAIELLVEVQAHQLSTIEDDPWYSYDSELQEAISNAIEEGGCVCPIREAEAKRIKREAELKLKDKEKKRKQSEALFGDSSVSDILNKIGRI